MRTIVEWKGETSNRTDPCPASDAETKFLLKRKRHPFLMPETMRLREKCLTATDMSSIVHKVKGLRGENKYKSRKNLMIEKVTGEKAPVFEAACNYGLHYEGEAMDVYELVTGNKLERNIGFIHGARYRPPGDESDIIVPDWIGCTPDAVCRDYPILVEIKCPYSKKIIGEWCPDLYWPQVQTQMAVTGIHLLHLVRYIPPDEVMTYNHETGMNELSGIVVPGTGRIDICEAWFNPSWWMSALSLACEFRREWDEIISGAREVPKKRSLPPRKRQCLLIMEKDSSLKVQTA